MDGVLDQLVFGASSASAVLVALWMAVKAIDRKISGLETRLTELDNRFSDLARTLQNDLKHLQEKHYALRTELAERYLRRDDWLAFHNKMEASLKTEIRDIMEAVRALYRKAD